MFQLNSTETPNTVETLRAAMEASLGKFFALPDGRRGISLTGDFPNLQEMCIDLDGAAVREDAPVEKPDAQGALQPGPSAARLVVHGRPLRAMGAQLEMTMEAKEVRFVYGRDEKGRLLMLPERVQAGHVEISIRLGQIETLLLNAANRALGKTVNITAVAVTLTQTAGRSLKFEAKVTAKKLISTVIRIQGKLDIDDRLHARASELSCAGEGMVGRAVSGLLGGHLQKLDGRQWPLMSVSLGQVRLKDVQLRVEDGLSIAAHFGS